MDLRNIGKFIADMRKERGLTQEQLGEKIGVTNKTVSRWETGVYLPPADALLALGELFGVSMNEILSGKRLNDADYKEAAEENLKQAIRSSCFSVKERTEFFKRKWLKEHTAVMIFVGICILAVPVCGIAAKSAVPVSITPLLIALAHAWRNKVFDGTGN